MKKIFEKNKRRTRRKMHVRKTVSGTAARPRLSVFRSNRYLYIQAIDDDKGVTLATLSTLEKEFEGMRPNVATAEKAGEAFGKRLKEKQIVDAVFDRNGFLYHGVIKSLADGVRKAGIKF